MEIIIKPTQNDYLAAIPIMLLGVLFIALGMYVFNNYEVWGSVIVLQSCRFYIYQVMDLLFQKKIVVSEENVYVELLWIKFEVASKGFLRIDDMLILSTTSVKSPTLNIYRNPSGLLGKIFKNKIKLSAVNKDNYEKTLQYATLISNSMNIEFKNSYMI